MVNDRESNPQNQQGSENAENLDRERKEQFNELSELSLEERIAVADRIGIPVDNVSDGAALGTAIGRDDTAGGAGERIEESTDEETDR